MALHSPTQNRAESLTIVRFFAAFMVFCDHYAYQMLEHGPSPLRNLLNRGSAGVHLFFILSGLLMVVVYGARYQSAGIDAKKFLVNRFARIYPAYFFALILSLQGAYNWIKSVGIPPTLNVPVYVISKLTMTDGWYLGTIDPHKSFNWMLQGWSLSSELLFYILFPFLIPHFVKLKPASAIGVALASFAAGPLIFRLLQALGEQKGGLAERLSLADSAALPLANLPPFAMGMAAGMLLLHWGPRIKRRRELQLTAVGITLAYQTLTPEVGLPSLIFVGLQVCYTFLIFALGLEFYQQATAPSGAFKRFLIVLGETSYSMYLLQSAVFTWSSLILLKLGLRAREAPQDWTFFTITLIATCLLSFLVWKYVETPARRFIQKKLLK